MEADETQHEQLAAMFDLHMIEATQNNPYQLNIDACLKDGKISFRFYELNGLTTVLDAEGAQPKQTTPVIRKRRNTQICSRFKQWMYCTNYFVFLYRFKRFIE